MRPKSYLLFIILALSVGIVLLVSSCASGPILANTSDNNTDRLCLDETEAFSYVSKDPEACKTMLFQCLPGKQPFTDSCGCGCKDLPVLNVTPLCRGETDGTNYVSRSLDDCARIRYMCVSGTEPFQDGCGCGCAPAEDAGPVPDQQGGAAGACPAESLGYRYLGHSSDECSRMKISCENGTEVFFNECGCGCGPASDADETEKTSCEPSQREAEACIELYQPVCGWFNSSIQCVVYPCAQTYSNTCFACMEDQVEYWTPGECPRVR